MVTPTLFIAGNDGEWRVDTIRAMKGADLFSASYLRVTDDIRALAPASEASMLGGVRSNLLYTTKIERDRLLKVQPLLDRSDASCAALIPIKKSGFWWSLAQDKWRQSLMDARGFFSWARIACQLWRAGFATAATLVSPSTF
jgi:hypothetical protein